MFSSTFEEMDINIFIILLCRSWNAQILILEEYTGNNFLHFFVLSSVTLKTYRTGNLNNDSVQDSDGCNFPSFIHTDNLSVEKYIWFCRNESCNNLIYELLMAT